MCARACVFVYVGCTFHWQAETIMDSTWSFNPLTIGSVGQEARGGQLCVSVCALMCVCVCSLGMQECLAVTHTHTQSVTHLIIHTGFYSQLHIVHTHTHTHTQLQPVQLVRARRGSTDRFWEPLNVIINFRGVCLCVWQRLALVKWEKEVAV